MGQPGNKISLELQERMKSRAKYIDIYKKALPLPQSLSMDFQMHILQDGGQPAQNWLIDKSLFSL